MGSFSRRSRSRRGDGVQILDFEEVASAYARLPPSLLQEARSFVLAEWAACLDCLHGVGLRVEGLGFKV